MTVQPGLCRTWSETPKTGFLTTRLIRALSGLPDLILCCSQRQLFNDRARVMFFQWIKSNVAINIREILHGYMSLYKFDSLCFMFELRFLSTSQHYMSRVMRKQTFCMWENKDTDQLRSNCEADQRLCFCYTDTTIPPLSKSKISSL